MCHKFTGLLCVLPWLLHLQGSNSCSVDFQNCEDVFKEPVKIGRLCIKEARNRTVERSECYQQRLQQLEGNRDCSCADRDVHRAIVLSAPHDANTEAHARCTVNRPPNRRCRLTDCMIASKKLRVFLQRMKRRPGSTCGGRARKTKRLLAKCLWELKKADKSIQDCGNAPAYIARYGKLYIAYISVLCSGCEISEVTRPCNRIPSPESNQPCYAVAQINKMRDCGLEQVKEWEGCGAAASNFVRVSWDLAEERSKRACYAYIYAHTMMKHWDCIKNNTNVSGGKETSQPKNNANAKEKHNTAGRVPSSKQPLKKEISGRAKGPPTSEAPMLTKGKGDISHPKRLNKSKDMTNDSKTMSSSDEILPENGYSSRIYKKTTKIIMTTVASLAPSNGNKRDKSHVTKAPSTVDPLTKMRTIAERQSVKQQTSNPTSKRHVSSTTVSRSKDKSSKSVVVRSSRNKQPKPPENKIRRFGQRLYPKTTL